MEGWREFMRTFRAEQAPKATAAATAMIEKIDDLVDPVVEEMKEQVSQAVGKSKVEEAAKDLVCETCGKNDFKTVRGYKGHQRKHETVVCPTCKKEFSALGFGGHAKYCTPGPRGRGRPRHPIAETLDRGKRTKAPSGPEIPILDHDEETLSAEDFKAPEPAAASREADEDAVLTDLSDIILTVRVLINKLGVLSTHLDQMLHDGSNDRAQ